MGVAMTVHAPGAQALLEDLGRPGYAHLGVTESGAFDRSALQLANRLLGNEPAAAAVEVLGGGLEVSFDDAVTVAVAGAAGPLAVGGTPVERWTPIRVPRGARVLVGQPSLGLRSYLAVRGGLLGELELGSRSTDPTTGLGPKPLADGDRLEVGARPAGGVRGADVTALSAPAREVVVLAWWGPRADWLTDEARRIFTRTRWSISSDSDRVGVRLEGATLERARSGELPSEGMIRGAVQVPPSGQPVVFGPDHPVTGGYPVVAVVADCDLDRFAQLAPGAGVRFRVVGA